MDQSWLIAAPPPTQRVIANAKPSRPSSRLSTCFKLIRGDECEVKREDMKGMREGVRDRDRERT